MNATLTAPIPAKIKPLATSEDLQRLQRRIPSLINSGTKTVTLAHQPDGTMTVLRQAGIITGTHNGRRCTYLVRRVGPRYHLEIVQ